MQLHSWVVTPFALGSICQQEHCAFCLETHGARFCMQTTNLQGRSQYFPLKQWPRLKGESEHKHKTSRSGQGMSK